MLFHEDTEWIGTFNATIQMLQSVQNTLIKLFLKNNEFYSAELLLVSVGARRHLNILIYLGALPMALDECR